MTEEKLKQANKLKEEIISVKRQLANANDFVFDYIEFVRNVEDGKMVRNVIDGTDEIEMVREFIKNINKAKLERLQKEFDEL